ncbi:MAG: hypothetical protein ACLR3S_07100 [Clostridium fessum]
MMDVEIKWNKTSDQIAKEKTRGNDGLLFLANEGKTADGSMFRLIAWPCPDVSVHVRRHWCD